MKYFVVLLFWGLINLPITFIAWDLKANMFHISLYFFIGVFLILIVGVVEIFKEEKIEDEKR